MKVYAVYTHDYSGESAIEVYVSEDKMLKDIKEDMNSVFKMLKEDGYEPTVDGINSIYVADSDIYYEWEVFETELRK